MTISIVNQMIIQDKLNRMKKDIETAIYESTIAIGDAEKGYPYAAGYSRECLKNILNEIESIKSYLTEV